MPNSNFSTFEHVEIRKYFRGLQAKIQEALLKFVNDGLTADTRFAIGYTVQSILQEESCTSDNFQNYVKECIFDPDRDLYKSNDYTWELVIKFWLRKCEKLVRMAFAINCTARETVSAIQS